MIDVHCHAFPQPKIERITRWVPGLKSARSAGRSVWSLASPSLHTMQTYVRHLPTPLRESLDQWGSLVPLSGLIFESTLNDLITSLRKNAIQKAVLIAHPQSITNAFVLEAARRHPEIIPAVNLTPGTPQPGTVLEAFIREGARALKIHAAADGEGPDSPHYRALLNIANEARIPVILHTGCFHGKFFYKNPKASEASLFEPWFSQFPKLTFILAHMNFHKPDVAIDLAERYSNVVLDTSWQPAEIIGEAVRRAGADRVLFGSDWPFLGNSHSVMRNRIEDCVQSGWISRAQADRVLGFNAARVFGLTSEKKD